MVAEKIKEYLDEKGIKQRAVAEKAGMTDELEVSVDYGSVCQLINKVMTENTYKLINKGDNIFESELLALDENETTIDLHIGHYSQIFKIKINTGGQVDDILGDMGIEI